MKRFYLRRDPQTCKHDTAQHGTGMTQITFSLYMDLRFQSKPLRASLLEAQVVTFKGIC